MDMNAYQQAALRTAAPKDKPNEVFHLLLGLVGETDEIAEKAKKVVRDQDSDFSQWDREDLAKELGDTLWYVAVLADHFDLPVGRRCRAQHREAGRPTATQRAQRQRRQPLTIAGHRLDIWS